MSNGAALESDVELLKYKEAYEGSGLSQSAYCKKEGLPYKRFNYLLHKLNNQATKGAFKFIEARAKEVCAPLIKEERGSVRLELLNGVVVVLEISADLPLSVILNAAAGAY